MSYADKLSDISKTQQLLFLDENGNEVIYPVRVPMAGEFVIIDAINYVCDISAFDTFELMSINATASDIFNLDLSDEQYNYMVEMVAEQVQMHLNTIFGNEFNLLPMLGGIHRYKKGFYIKGFDNEVLGTVGLGGQNNTVFIGITGTGCRYAKNGFEHNLHDFLSSAPKARITRIDLAHDDFGGNYSSFELANEKESNGDFMLPKARIRPAVLIHGEHKHNDPYKKGLTLNVGSRKNGKVIRCYEKGKQLGDKLSQWFRGELEMHNKAVKIPFDVLLRPTEFFCGAYPYCLELIELAKKHKGDMIPQLAEKFESVKKQAEISLDKAVRIVKHQFGGLIKCLGDIFSDGDKPDYEKIFEMVVTDKQKDYFPKRLKVFKYLENNCQNKDKSTLQKLNEYYRSGFDNKLLENFEIKINKNNSKSREIYKQVMSDKFHRTRFLSPQDEFNQLMIFWGYA